MPQPLFVSPTHILFQLLAPESRGHAHQLAEALQIPPNPTALTRLLGRALEGLAGLSNAGTAPDKRLVRAAQLLEQWKASTGAASESLAGFYGSPVDRDPTAANPALGYKSTHPLYAALVLPPLPAAEEALYSKIVGAAVALALRTEAPSPDDLSRASLLAEEARQRAEGVLPVFRNLSEALATAIPSQSDMSTAAKTAFAYLRVRGIASSTSLTDSERALLRQWLRALEAIGSSATGKGLLKLSKPRPGQNQFTVEADDDVTALILCPRTDRHADSGPDDEPAADPVAVGPDTPPEAAPPRKDEARLQAERAWTVATRAGAMLPLSWSAFTPYEIEVLHQHLEGLPVDVGASIIRAGLACGLRPRAIAIALDSGTSPDGFVLKSSAEFFEVERVLTATDLSRQIQPKDDCRFLPADGQVAITSLPIPLSKDGYSAALDHTLTKLRQDRRLRLSDGRVARTLVMDFIRASPDTFVADIALNASTLQGLSGAPYYSAMRASELARCIEHPKHRARAQVQPSGTLIGSHGIPSVDTLKSAIGSLSSQVETARSALDAPADLARFHNSFVGYELLLLMHASGHRLVTDPFPHEDCLLDSGHFVIADKVSTPSHTTRLTVASELAKKQWERHRAHLLELSYRMAFLKSPDADQVQGVVDGITPVSAPFFFFLTDDLRLERVTPKGFADRLGANWGLPTSAHRQFMSFALREAGCPAELIHAHLGHWLRGDAPFGPTSLLRPSQLVQALSEPIDKVLTLMGLIPRDGLPVAGVYRRHAADTYDPRPCSPLGPVLRSTARKPAPQEPTLVDDVLAAACWNFGVDVTSSRPASVPRDAVVSARDVLSKHFGADSDGLKRALRRLRRVCSGLRNKGWGIWIPGAPYSPMDSPPVLADFSGRSARVAKDIQIAFHDWLVTRVDSLEPAELHATALLSAVLRGGLLREHDWNHFLIALRDGAWRAESVDWLEIGASRKPGHRYIGDAVTRGFIRRAVAVDPKQTAQQLLVLANELLRSICKNIKRLDPIAGIHGASLRIDSLKQILPCLIDRYATQVSGLTLAHMRGDLSTYSTTPEHLVRQLTGKRFASAPRKEEPEFGDTLGELPVRRATAPEKVYQQIEEFLGILNTAQADSDTEHSVEEKARRRHKRRTDLRVQLSAFRSRLVEGGCPTSLFRIVQYAIHLAEYGGLQEEELAPSTIQEYAGLKVKEFVQCLGPSDPAELDGDERTMIYRRLLKQSDSPTGWAKRLRYFDFFVHTEFDIDPADWRSLAPELPALGGSVYDYLTLADINRLDTIASTLDAGDRLDSATATSLRFLSRSGMRSGEAYRLALTDLGPAPLAYLRVENKASGEVKTRSGIRHASVFSLPTVRDVDPVSVAKAFSEESATVGDGSLFSSTKASLGISRSNLLHRMKSSICLATGHSRSRPHHGRHSIVSHGVLLAVDLPHPLVLKALGGISADEYERAHAALRLQLTGRRGTTMLWRIAFPQTVGHKEFATSVEHYLHVVDILLAAETDLAAGEVSPALSASLMGISPNAFYQAKDRAKRQGALTAFHDLLMARRSSPAAPRSQAFPSLTDTEPKFARERRRPLREATLVQLGALVGAVFSGASDLEIAARYGAEENDVKALRNAVEDMQIFFGGKIAALQSDRAGNPALLAADVGKACALLHRSDKADSWDSLECEQHAGRLLACWRPSHRHFDSPNALALTAVETWLRYTNLKPLREPEGDGAILRFRKLNTTDGLLLSAVVLIAYMSELRSRVRRCAAS